MNDNHDHEMNETPIKKAKLEIMSSDEDDENLTYDQIRNKRLKKNMDMLQVLGINQAAEKLANSIKKKQTLKKTSLSKSVKSKEGTIEPIRRSQRLANLPPEILIETNNDIQNTTNEERYNKVSVLDKDSISVPKEDSEYFEKLSADLVIKEAVNDFNACDFVKFTNVVKSLENNEFPRITKNRIYSLAIHPSETSLIIAAGDLKGNIILFNNSNPTESRDYQLHDRPVNCISFCSWDSFKLFSTSHDGSVRCGDIDKRTFDIIYTSDFHSTWHTEFERNLLIGNGSGRVDLIDTRTPNKINNTVWCHERSVRTVHCHPLEKHYFITSSGLGEVSLWDIRNASNQTINPVLKFEHSKAVSSAFFSASGTNMVSTSNDNFIRLFNTSNLNTKATKPVQKIKHDNHTGRWLSVFKAKWNPGRDDAFFVGSMEVPKRIEIYRSNGKLLYNLTSPSMTTYCPVIEVHPTQAIYVGGNASGRLHIFNTKEQL